MPAAGSVRGGTRITIVGTGFHAPVAVRFDRAAGRAVHLLSSTRLTVVTPAHVAGWSSVSVHTPYGWDNEARSPIFVYHPTPRVGSLTPAVVPSSGNPTLTVRGEGFERPVAVALDGHAVPSVFIHETELYLAVPDLVPGGHRITITTRYGSTTVPLPVVQAPARIGVSGNAIGRLTLQLVGPPQSYPVTLTVRRAEGSTAPATIADGTAILAKEATSTQVTDTSVVPGQTYSYSVFATSPGGAVSSPASVTVRAVRDLETTIGTVTAVDAAARQVTGLSCPAVDTCMVVDASGFVAAERAGTWAAPAEVLPGGSLAAVSCPSTAFCAAAGLSPLEGSTARVAAFLTYEGGTWSASTPLPPAVTQLSAVSCASAVFCVATGSGVLDGILTQVRVQWDGRDWSAPAGIGSFDGAVQCPTTSFCMVSDGGGTLRYDGTSWSLEAAPGATGGFLTVSCIGPGFCKAETLYREVYTWDGARWNRDAERPWFTSRRLVCASPAACLASPGGPWLADFDGVTWSGTRSLGATLAGVPVFASRPDPAVCLLVSGHGDFAAATMPHA